MPSNRLLLDSSIWLSVRQQLVKVDFVRLAESSPSLTYLLSVRDTGVILFRIAKSCCAPLYLGPFFSLTQIYLHEPSSTRFRAAIPTGRHSQGPPFPASVTSG